MAFKAALMEKTMWLFKALKAADTEEFQHPALKAAAVLHGSDIVFLRC